MDPLRPESRNIAAELGLYTIGNLTPGIDDARVRGKKPFDVARGGWAGINKGPSGISGLIDRVHNLLEKNFLTAHDGLLAYDRASGKIYAGIDPSAVEHEMPRFGSPLETLLHILAPREDGVPMTFTSNGRDFAARPTGREAEKGVSLEGGLGSALLAMIDREKGGIADLTIRPNTTSKTLNAQSTTANVLMLPRDYDGPIFISDIDDTLRATQAIELAEGERQKPIAGVTDILQGVAAMGVPIIYLSAGTTAIHAQNKDFLSQLPKGILLDNQDFKLSLRDLVNHDSALDQAAYKKAVIDRIRATYPNAKLFGIGDDKYGDAIAYTEGGVRAWIHDVKPDRTNVPQDFSGIMTPSYTPAFIAELLGEIRAGVEASKRSNPEAQ